MSQPRQLSVPIYYVATISAVICGLLYISSDSTDTVMLGAQRPFMSRFTQLSPLAYVLLLAGHVSLAAVACYIYKRRQDGGPRWQMTAAALTGMLSLAASVWMPFAQWEAATVSHYASTRFSSEFWQKNLMLARYERDVLWVSAALRDPSKASLPALEAWRKAGSPTDAPTMATLARSLAKDPRLALIDGVTPQAFESSSLEDCKDNEWNKRLPHYGAINDALYARFRRSTEATKQAETAAAKLLGVN